MGFRITGLDAAQFRQLFAMSDEELRRRNSKRYVADAKPGFPCRITLEDAEPGETLILTNYRHQTASSPYASQGPIFVREREAPRAACVDEVPVQLTRRLVSLRAYDRCGMMIDADVAEGAGVKPLIERLLADPQTDYVHAHFARRGCYAALIERT